MLKVSLIVATLGERLDDLSALLQSLITQVDFISEIIIVDQNPDRQRIPRLLVQFRERPPDSPYPKRTRTVSGQKSWIALYKRTVGSIS